MEVDTHNRRYMSILRRVNVFLRTLSSTTFNFSKSNRIVQV